MARERSERAGDGASLNGAQPNLPIAEIRKLISLMDGGDIEELTIEQESAGLKLTLRKPEPAAIGSAALLEDEWDAPEGHEANAEGDKRDASVVEIGAPLVGIFRVSMVPDARALVTDGDDVHEGQVVGAIEALNVLNEVETQTSGRVRKVLVADGQPVEYGQALLEIERA
jgi:acetyl-CoA carboxylase biotin carboxyl carrier protein